MEGTHPIPECKEFNPKADPRTSSDLHIPTLKAVIKKKKKYKKRINAAIRELEALLEEEKTE